MCAASPCFANSPSTPDQSSSSPTRRRAGPPSLCSARSARRPVNAVALPKVDEASEPELERGVVLLGGHGVPGARVLGVEQDQPGLDAGDVERADARGADPVVLAGGEHPVPHGERAVDRDPDLVAAVARVARARDAHVDPGDRATGGAGSTARPASPRRSRPRSTSRESFPCSASPASDSVTSSTSHVEAGRVQHEPAVAGVGGGDPVLLLAEAGDRCRRRAPCRPRRTTACRRPGRPGSLSRCRGSSPGRAAAPASGPRTTYL